VSVGVQGVVLRAPRSLLILVERLEKLVCRL